jgi:lipoprotein-anchoring transpeptidase ErfK/SrfK
LASAAGNDRASALSATLHGRRPGQSARRTRHVIYGTNAPETIGQAVSSGCFRLVNDDVIDLYNRVSVGTKVIVRQD